LRYAPFPRSLQTHFGGAKLLRNFFIAPPKRRKQPERYTQFLPKKVFDKIKKLLYKEIWTIK
jgi:hypothetical protein